MTRLWLLLLAAPVAAEPHAEAPRFTVACDHDGWTCFDNFPAISKDHLTIVNAVTRGEKIVTEFVSVASGRVLRRETAFVADPRFPTRDRIAKLHRELREFRAMARAAPGTETYQRGTVTLVIGDCAAPDCRTTYRVTRRRRRARGSRGASRTRCTGRHACRR